MNLTRRRFLGGLLASVPLAYVPLSRWRIKEAEYTLGFVGFPCAVITAFTDGTLEGEYGGVRMSASPKGRWTVFSAKVDGVLFETAVERPEPNVLHVDFIAHYGSVAVNGVEVDSFGSYFHPGTRAPQFSYQPSPLC